MLPVPRGRQGDQRNTLLSKRVAARAAEYNRSAGAIGTPQAHNRRGEDIMEATRRSMRRHERDRERGGEHLPSSTSLGDQYYNFGFSPETSASAQYGKRKMRERVRRAPLPAREEGVDYRPSEDYHRLADTRLALVTGRRFAAGGGGEQTNLPSKPNRDMRERIRRAGDTGTTQKVQWNRDVRRDETARIPLTRDQMATKHTIKPVAVGHQGDKLGGGGGLITAFVPDVTRSASIPTLREDIAQGESNTMYLTDTQRTHIGGARPEDDGGGFWQTLRNAIAKFARPTVGYRLAPPLPVGAGPNETGTHVRRSGLGHGQRIRVGDPTAPAMRVPAGAPARLEIAPDTGGRDAEAAARWARLAPVDRAPEFERYNTEHMALPTYNPWRTLSSGTERQIQIAPEGLPVDAAQDALQVGHGYEVLDELAPHEVQRRQIQARPVLAPRPWEHGGLTSQHQQWALSSVVPGAEAHEAASGRHWLTVLPEDLRYAGGDRAILQYARAAADYRPQLHVEHELMRAPDGRNMAPAQSIRDGDAIAPGERYPQAPRIPEEMQAGGDAVQRHITKTVPMLRDKADVHEAALAEYFAQQAPTAAQFSSVPGVEMQEARNQQHVQGFHGPKRLSDDAYREQMQRPEVHSLTVPVAQREQLSDDYYAHLMREREKCVEQQRMQAPTAPANMGISAIAQSYYVPPSGRLPPQRTYLEAPRQLLHTQPQDTGGILRGDRARAQTDAYVQAYPYQREMRQMVV